MIETNIFIDACKRNNVQVMTPMMIYDFAHPIMGSSHMKMFREEVQRAADYLQYQIRGRLVAPVTVGTPAGCGPDAKYCPAL
jgi:uncharacterized protein (UPF0254 family)